MTSITVGKPIKNFELQCTSGKKFNLSELKGKNVILYFYPKDNTPGCTMESKDFRDNHENFEKLNTVILGISPDSIASHEKFKAKHCFPFELVSDENDNLLSYFGARKQKSMFGKTFLGVERCTFLIDKNGVLQREWRNVKVTNHVKEVLEAVKAL